MTPAPTALHRSSPGPLIDIGGPGRSSRQETRSQASRLKSAMLAFADDAALARLVIAATATPAARSALTTSALHSPPHHTRSSCFAGRRHPNAPFGYTRAWSRSPIPRSPRIAICATAPSPTAGRVLELARRVSRRLHRGADDLFSRYESREDQMRRFVEGTARGPSP